jgi:DNA invertase Pin-like site-specific DNA recombinase
MPARSAAIYLYNADPQGEHRAMLEAIATAHGWRVTEVHHDTAGTRPSWRELQASVMAARLDAIMVYDISELGSSVLAVVETAAWLDEQGVHLLTIDPPLDTGTPDGRRLLQLIRHLAGYSADLRRQRYEIRRPRRRPPAG